MDLCLDTSPWHYSPELSYAHLYKDMDPLFVYHHFFCWSFPIRVLSKFLRLYAFIRAAFVTYLRGLILLSWNTFHLHSLSSLTPFVTRLMRYSRSNHYISPLHPTRNTITWLPCDHTEPTHQILGTRLTPKNLAQMSYHVTMHNATRVRSTCTSMSL